MIRELLIKGYIAQKKYILLVLNKKKGLQQFHTCILFNTCLLLSRHLCRSSTILYNTSLQYISRLVDVLSG